MILSSFLGNFPYDLDVEGVDPFALIFLNMELQRDMARFLIHNGWVKPDEGVFTLHYSRAIAADLTTFATAWLAKQLSVPVTVTFSAPPQNVALN